MGFRYRILTANPTKRKESQDRSDWLVRQQFARQRQTNDTPDLLVISCFVLGLFIALIAASR